MFDRIKYKTSLGLSLFVYLAALLGVVVYKFILPIPAYSPYFLGYVRFFTVMFALTAVFYIAAFRFDWAKKTVHDYFTAVSHPVILAIFRVFFFVYLLSDNTYVDSALFYCRFSKELMFPPFGTGWLSAIVPINESWMSVAVVLFKVFCWMGLLGIGTRISTVMTAILFFYVGGVPQLFGKVNHYHNLFWFSAILAVSPCADYLSVDAIFKAFRRADKGVITPPQPSQAYGLPIRFIWLLYGVAYFGPGFWKIWNDGKGWILGDSLRNHMYSRWMDYPGWLPAFRVDHYPALCRLGGTMAIVFEMGFIFLIFSPVLRWLAVAGAITFHTLNEYFFRIYFAQLKNFYFIFFPLDRILDQIGKWVFPKGMTVFFDGNCELCRRTIAALRVFDIFERIKYLNSLAAENRLEMNAAGINEETALRDMCATCGGKVYKGFAAYRVMAFRIPLLWPVLPVLYIWPVTAIGNGIYRKIADSRRCAIPLKRDGFADETHKTSITLVIVGSILIAANSFCGVLKIDRGWPFASYPTFSHVQWLTQGMIEFEIVDKDGHVSKLQNKDYLEKFDRGRFKALVSEIVDKDPALKIERLKALWAMMAREWPDLSSAHSVRFYEIRESKIPEEKYLNPLSRTFIYELHLQE